MARALGIIADDFTGGLLVAGSLEAAGIASPVLFTPVAAASAPIAPVLILATRARLLPVAEAMQIVESGAAALDAAGCTQVAYKACASFDSTPEGNIGPAADLLADRYGNAPVLMSAGFPAFNATVHQGYLFYRGRLVSDSIKRFDPFTPMSDPDLVRFLSLQTRSPVRLIAHAQLRQGAAVAQDALRLLLDEGARHVLLDTTDDGDVETSAGLAVASRALVVASDPLVMAFARRLVAGLLVRADAPPRHADGPAAVLAGSVGPVVLAQLARFGDQHPVLTLDLLDPRSEGEVIAAALDWARPRLGADPLAISTATGPEGVQRAQASLGPQGAGQKAERLLGAIAVGLRERGVRRFVVVGGETSGAVVNALGIEQVRALPEGPLGSGFCVTAGPVPLSLYLKPGKLGADDILLQAVAAMQP